MWYPTQYARVIQMNLENDQAVAYLEKNDTVTKAAHEKSKHYWRIAIEI